MANVQLGTVARHLHMLIDEGTVGALPDGALLVRFASRGGEVAELAFEALYLRHGPMVLRACRTILHDEHEAQDALQAVFLVLALRAGSLRVRDSLGPWLHQVACRVASCARSAAARRRRLERKIAELAADRTSAGGVWDDLGPALHAEIDRLPDRYRCPVVLCCLEGLTREEAARQLGWPVGTVQSRLARGRERLRGRLTRLGLVPSSSAMGIWFSAERAGAAVAPALSESQVWAAIRLGASKAAAGMVPASIVTLAEGAMKIMLVTKLRMFATGLVMVGLVSAGAVVSARQEPKSKEVSGPVGKEARAVARVNEAPITREELVERLLADHGAEVLDKMISMAILRDACRRRGVVVTDAEVLAEAARIASAAGKVSLEEWLRLLKAERGLSKDKYLDNIVAPKLMLDKLKGDRTPDTTFNDLKREARVEILLEAGRGRDREGTESRRSRQQRIDALQKTLQQALKELDDLKREGSH